MWTSFLIGLLVFILSIKPISLIAWVNLFALGGQEIVFFCPLILGLYWKGANATGAIASIFTGIITYLTLEILKTKKKYLPPQKNTPRLSRWIFIRLFIVVKERHPLSASYNKHLFGLHTIVLRLFQKVWLL